jgi:hypothetical protein
VLLAIGISPVVGGNSLDSETRYILSSFQL